MTEKNIEKCPRCRIRPLPCNCGSSSSDSEGDNNDKKHNTQDKSNTRQKFLSLNETNQPTWLKNIVYNVTNTDKQFTELLNNDKAPQSKGKAANAFSSTSVGMEQSKESIAAPIPLKMGPSSPGK